MQDLKPTPVRRPPARRLRLEPLPRRPGLIGARLALRDDAFQAHTFARGEKLLRSAYA